MLPLLKGYVDEVKGLTRLNLYTKILNGFNWHKVRHIIPEERLEEAWINEVRVSKHFSDFKLERLEKVSFTENIDVDSIETWYFELLAKESLHGFDNSLATHK